MFSGRASGAVVRRGDESAASWALRSWAAVLGGKEAQDFVTLAPEGGALRQRNFYHRQYKAAVEAAGLPAQLR